MSRASKSGLGESLNDLLQGLEVRLGVIQNNPRSTKSQSQSDLIARAVALRSQALAASVTQTVEQCKDLAAIVELFYSWMTTGAVVRVVGAGRARLAAAIPANRLAHGGARVFVQGDIIPMPHTVRCGGIIAASASGRTKPVLDLLETVRAEAPEITIVGIASHEAEQFREKCHLFIGVRHVNIELNPLRALADMGEYVVSEVLDALVVAAGRLGNFDERHWQLGHENIGDTGPYDAKVSRVDLLFNEF